MTALGERVHGAGSIYLTGGATALLYGGLVNPRELRRQFEEIVPLLVRYPAIDPGTFEGAVAAFCAEVAREGES